MSILTVIALLTLVIIYFVFLELKEVNDENVKLKGQIGKLKEELKIKRESKK